MRSLTREEAIRLFHEQWADMQKALGDNPSYKERCRFKHEWCEEKFPGEVVTNDCFLCEYTEQHSVGCGECPIKWHGHCTGDVDYRYSTISEILALPERRIGRMKVKKIVQVVQELHIDINGITLLSIDEYTACKANIKPVNGNWWLRSPGNIVSAVAVVDGESGHVYVTGNNVGIAFGVRPALKISKSNNLQIGEQFGFGDKVWTIVGDEFALADEAICLMPFRENWYVAGANDYESSDIKKYLDEWLVDKQQDELLGDG